MKIKPFHAVLVLGLLFTCTCPTQAQPVTGLEQGISARWPEGPVEGTIAPLFHLRVIDSHELVYLSSYRGKRVVLYFTASWADSATQLVRLARFRREHADKGGEVLGISVDTVPRARMLPLLKTIDADDLPFVVDPMLSATHDYGIQKVPSIVFLDEHGRVVIREENLDDLRFLEVMKRISSWVEKPLEEDPGTGEGLLARKQQVLALEKRIMRRQQDIGLRDQIAVACFDAGLYDKALNQLDVADAMEPNNIRAIRYWRRGVLYDAMGDSERALDYWRASAMALDQVQLIEDNLQALRQPGLVYGYIPSATEVR